MSKFLEYLSLVPKGLKNPEQLIEGWYNEIKSQFKDLPEDEQKEILRRRMICNQCPLNSINAQSSEEYKKLYGQSYKTERQDFHCAICSCPLNAKTSSLSSDCGLTDYNDKHKDNIQELKWTKFNKNGN